MAREQRYGWAFKTLAIHHSLGKRNPTVFCFFLNFHWFNGFYPPLSFTSVYIHWLATLIGIPVHLVIYAIIWPANHVAAACRRSARALVNVHVIHQHVEKMPSQWFDLVSQRLLYILIWLNTYAITTLLTCLLLWAIIICIDLLCTTSILAQIVIQKIWEKWWILCVL